MLDELHYDDLASQRDLMDAVLLEKRVGCVVRGVVHPAACAAALGIVEGMAAKAPRRELCAGAHTLGILLAPTVSEPHGPDLSAYLAAAASFRAEGALPPQQWERVERALRTLADERPLVCPTSKDGRRYASATLRVFQPGAEAAAHNDTYNDLACHRELDTMRDRRGQWSWYLPLSIPESGGALLVYTLKQGQVAAADPERAVQDLTAARYQIGVGDLVVFDGGRHVHSVERCDGKTPRRTLGGFASLSADHTSLLVWS